MAKDTHNAPATLPAFDEKAVEGLTNLAARFPQYDGGDGRSVKNGFRAPPIHGYLLGTIDLPSKQLDENGNPKPWVAMVVELLQPCPVKEGTEDNLTRRIAAKGERILVTESEALKKFSPAADHPTQVVECVIKPEMSRNKKGQPLWVFPTVAMGRPIPRDPVKHMVGIADFLPAFGAHEDKTALPARGTTTHNAAATDAEVPFS